MAVHWCSSGDGVEGNRTGLASPTCLLTQVSKSDQTPDAWPLGSVRLEWQLSGYQFEVIGEQFKHWLLIGPNDMNSAPGHLIHSGVGLAHFTNP